MSNIVSPPQSKGTQQVLLMTATITPNNAKNLLRVDPKMRLEDYFHALEFYLGMMGQPLAGIVFVENSASDVSMLRQLVKSRGLDHQVEFICNYGSYVYTEQGRAYGEFKLLDHAMTVSNMIRGLSTDAIVWKVTGRYKVMNLGSIIASAPRNFDVYVDMKDHPRRWLDTRLMAFTPSGYERVFRGVADDLDARTHEAVMRDYLPMRAQGALLVPRFRREPFIEGVRGWDNSNYSKGGELIKCYVRSLGRAVAPWCWI